MSWPAQWQLLRAARVQDGGDDGREPNLLVCVALCGRTCLADVGSQLCDFASVRGVGH